MLKLRHIMKESGGKHLNNVKYTISDKIRLDLKKRALLYGALFFKYLF